MNAIFSLSPTPPIKSSRIDIILIKAWYNVKLSRSKESTTNSHFQTIQRYFCLRMKQSFFIYTPLNVNQAFLALLVTTYVHTACIMHI
jgi:hypothetical protein